MNMRGRHIQLRAQQPDKNQQLLEKNIMVTYIAIDQAGHGMTLPLLNFHES